MSMGCDNVGCRKAEGKVGVLIAQLGTPDAPEPASLKKYLRQFLWDPRVIEGNRTLWYFILNFVVLRSRPERSARLYKRIWRDEGSPLLLITRKQTDGVRALLKKENPDIEVEFGMRYGSPSLESTIDQLIERGCDKILLFPMYPQYSATTTASTYDAVFQHLLKRRWVPTLRVAEPYHNRPDYLQAQADIINEAYRGFDSRPEKLVLSYHGIPEAYIEKGDPYCCMCTESTNGLLPLLEIPADQVVHTYQSRFGKDPWLEPYSDETIEGLARKGVKHIAVACPGFTADCLETLDEMGHEALELFRENGGERLDLIPCLNDHPSFLKGMTNLIRMELGNWMQAKSNPLRYACPVKQAKDGRSSLPKAA